MFGLHYGEWCQTRESNIRRLVSALPGSKGEVFSFGANASHFGVDWADQVIL